MAQEIDWSQIQGAYGVVKDMPQQLKAIENGDNKALDDVMDRIVHQHTLFDIAIPILPFIFEILSKDNKADKAQILDNLHFIIQTINDNVAYSSYVRADDLRLFVDIQLEFKRCADVFLVLLTDKKSTVRLHTSAFLAQYVAYDVACNELKNAIAIETDSLARAMFIYHLGILLSDNGTLHKTYNQDFFLNYLLNDASHEVQVAGALACISCGMDNELVFDKLFDVVIKEYYDLSLDISYESFMKIKAFKTINPTQNFGYDAEYRKVAGWDEKVMREREKAAQDPFASKLPDYLAETFLPEWIFKFLLSKSYSIQEQMLQSPKTTRLMAHIICRHLVDTAFQPPQPYNSLPPIQELDDSWLKFIPRELQDQKSPWEMHYESNSRKRARFDSPLTPPQYSSLKTVVECDKFWLLPTNLFSFFYGLPDDREALRELAAKNKPTYIKE